MARVIMVLNHPVLKVATTQAGLAAGTAFECQVTSAVISANPQFNTIPATGCAPSVQSPGLTQYQLDLAWLQDWVSTGGGGLSGFALTHDAQPVWFSLTLDSVGAPTVIATGNAYCTSGQYGGTFGDGSAAAATATWPMLDKPTIPLPATAAADAELADATV
jgi:hypothetical protein